MTHNARPQRERRRMFKAVFYNGTTNAETIPTSDFSHALRAMNELMDNYKYGDFAKVEIDASYNKGIPEVWRKREPDAIALRVFHAHNYGRKTIMQLIGKVVMC